MAVKLYEIHTELFKAIGEEYAKFGNSDLIKLDLLTKLLINDNVNFRFVKEDGIYLVADNFSPRALNTIKKLKYTVTNGRIKLL
jgi:hypothetical protein